MTNLQTINHPKKLTFDLTEAQSLVMLIEASVRNHPATEARGIMNMISHGTPAWKIIKDIQGIADNNYMLVSGILGESLTNTIVNF